MPSKKVISIFIICSALVFTIIIISKPEAPYSNSNLKSTVSVSGKNPEVNTGDNPNWQKEISGIGEGVIAPEEATSTEETLTDAFSRSFMSNYLALKQSGSYNDTSATNLINQSLDFINKTDIKQFEIKDIIISPDNSKASLTKYGNDLGSALKTNRPEGGAKNEMEIFKEMLRAEDPSFKKDLLYISETYNNLGISLSKIIVPSKFAEKHLSSMNALRAISEAVADLSTALEDPVKSIQAINSYEKNFGVLTENSRVVKVELVKAGVNYKQGENGYYFYFGI